MGLTARQLEAVAVEAVPRDTCVVAGPGSGKTTVLVAYFEQLVESGVDPLRILAITFTDKAANNMRDKLARTFQDRPEIRRKLEHAYVSTVHGFCTRLLKENAVFAGLDPDFYVMDERESLREQRRAVDEALDGMFTEEPERARALMRGLAAVDAGKEILEAYDAIRAAGIKISDLGGFAAPAAPHIARTIEEVRRLFPREWRADQLAHLQDAQDWLARIAAALPGDPGAALRAIGSFECKLTKLKRGHRVYDLIKSLKDDLLPALEYSLITSYYAAERATVIDLFARFDSLYRECKRQSGALDFSDLEEYAVRLLEEHPEVQRRLAKQFDQVLMDEFQDTNGQQARLLELLRSPGRFYAVGDINQSIYGFRHAEPSVFRGYRDMVAERGHRLVELVENFRSRPEILRAVEMVAAGAEGIEARPLVQGSSFPAKAEASVEVAAAPTSELEAQWVAARIVELEGRLQLRNRVAEFRDFAVLVRNSEVLNGFTQAFDDFGIPYLVNRGKGFYETREVVDLMHLLRVLANPRDEVSMAAVLRSPFVAVSDEALLRLKAIGNLGSAVEGLAPAILTVFAPDDAGKLAHFRDRLASWRTTRDYTSIDRLMLRAMDECGYACPGGVRGAANVEKFLAQARAASAHQTLAEFVEEIEMLRESKPREPDAPPEDSANAVKVMTVHAAKGLEFPVVFLASLHKGIDADAGAISFSPRIGLGLQWRHPLGGRNKSDSFRHAINAEMKQREREEGNRLLYVAMTRAEEHLALSFTASGKKPLNWAALVAERLPVRIVSEPPARPAARARQEEDVPAALLERPVLHAQHDSQANVTSIAMFADCPRRYYLSRYIGLEDSGAGLWPGPEGTPASQAARTPAVQFGQQVHALLAGAPIDSPDPEAVQLADQFRRSPLARRAAAAAHIEREFDFLMDVEGVVLRGQIDLWFEERGKTVLVDYKTDRVSVTAAPARTEQYALQLRLYALALERLTGRAPDEAYVYFLRPNTAVRVDLRPSLFDAPEAVVREFQEAQARQRFPLHEGEHCRTCPHFTRSCPARLVPEPAASPIPA
ncbi:MAG TPA: UvrD-helicase domain-containing protein [Bryobacteraceae bacterium]|nr:UvrD-helicase domain-containing protein [Bryobacteraceae bacterium]